MELFYSLERFLGFCSIYIYTVGLYQGLAALRVERAQLEPLLGEQP